MRSQNVIEKNLTFCPQRILGHEDRNDRPESLHSDAITLGGSTNQAITVDNTGSGTDSITDSAHSNAITLEGTGAVTVNTDTSGTDTISDDSSNTAHDGVAVYTISGSDAITLGGSTNQAITVGNIGSGTDSISDSTNSNFIILYGTGAVTVNTGGTDTIYDSNSNTAPGGITVNTTSGGSDAITLGGSYNHAITVDNTGSGTDSITDNTTGSHTDTITLIGAGSDSIFTNSTGGLDNITTTSSTATAINISNDTIYSTGTPSSSTLGLLPAITNTNISTATSSTAYSNVYLAFSADTAHALNGTASTITVDKFDTTLYSVGTQTNLQTAISVVIAALQAVDTTTTSGNYDAAAYFQYGGNTYIVNDYNHETSTTSNAYTDQVVQLTGTANLSTTTVNATTSVIHVG